MHRLTSALLVSLALVACTPQSPESESEAAAVAEGPAGYDGHVVITSPQDGAEVTSPVTVDMSAVGVVVAPAGTFEDNTGHFHLLIDTPFVATGAVIPSDGNHRHFGDGSATATLELTPGTHVIRLQMGDGAHLAMEGLHDEITVTVIDG